MKTPLPPNKLLLTHLTIINLIKKRSNGIISPIQHQQQGSLTPPELKQMPVLLHDIHSAVSERARKLRLGTVAHDRELAE